MAMEERRDHPSPFSSFSSSSFASRLSSDVCAPPLLTSRTPVRPPLQKTTPHTPHEDAAPVRFPPSASFSSSCSPSTSYTPADRPDLKEPFSSLFSSLSQPGRFSPASWLDACISNSLSTSSTATPGSVDKERLSAYTRASTGKEESSDQPSGISPGNRQLQREREDEETKKKTTTRTTGGREPEYELADRLERTLLHLEKEVQGHISQSFESLDAQSHELAAAGPMCLQELNTVSARFERADQTANAALKAFSVMDKTHHERLHKLAALEAIKRHFQKCRRILLDLHQWNFRVGEIELLLHSFQQQEHQAASVPSLQASPGPSSTPPADETRQLSSSSTGMRPHLPPSYSAPSNPPLGSSSSSFEQTATVALQRSLAQAAVHASALKNAVGELKAFPEFTGRVKAAELLEKRVSAVARNLLCKALRSSDAGGLQIAVEVFVVLERRVQLQEEFKRFLADQLRPQWHALWKQTAAGRWQKKKEMGDDHSYGRSEEEGHHHHHHHHEEEEEEEEATLPFFGSRPEGRRGTRSRRRPFGAEEEEEGREEAGARKDFSVDPSGDGNNDARRGLALEGGLVGNEEEETRGGRMLTEGDALLAYCEQLTKILEEKASLLRLFAEEVANRSAEISHPPHHPASSHVSSSRDASGKGLARGGGGGEAEGGGGGGVGGPQTHHRHHNRKRVEYREAWGEVLLACLKVGSEIPNASVTDYLRSLTAQPSPDEGDDGTGPGWAGGRGGDDEASLREISGEDRGSGRRKSHSSVESEGLLQTCERLLQTYETFQTLLCATPVVAESEPQVPQLWQKISSSCLFFPPLLLRTYNEALWNHMCALMLEESPSVLPFDKRQAPSQVVIELEDRLSRALQRLEKSLPGFSTTSQAVLGASFLASADSSTARFFSSFSPVIQTFAHTVRCKAKAALASRGGAEGVPGGADPLSCGVLSSGTERREGGVQTGGMDSFLGPGLVPLDMSLLSTCMQQFLLLIGLHRKLDQACTAVFKRAGAAYHRTSRFNSYLRIYVKQHPGLLVYPSPSLLARAEEVLASSAPHFSRKARPSPASSPPPPEPRLSESSSSPALFPPLSVICPESRKAYLNLLRAAKGLVVLTCSDPLSLFLQRYYPSVLQEAFRKSLPRQERPARGRERERRGGKEETFSYSENASHGEEETEGNLLPSAVMTAVGEFILHLLPHLDVGGGGVEENRFFSENRQGESFDAVDRQRKKTSQENTSTLLEAETSPSSLMGGVISSLAACFCRVLLLQAESSSASFSSFSSSSSMVPQGSNSMGTPQNTNAGTGLTGGPLIKMPSKQTLLSAKFLSQRQVAPSSSSSSSSSSCASTLLRSTEVLRQLSSDVQYLCSLCRSLGFDPIADAVSFTSRVGRRYSERETDEKEAANKAPREGKESERPEGGGEESQALQARGLGDAKKKKGKTEKGIGDVDERKDTDRKKEGNGGREEEDEAGELTRGEDNGRRQSSDAEDGRGVRSSHSVVRPAWMIGFLVLGLQERLRGKEEDQSLLTLLVKYKEEAQERAKEKRRDLEGREEEEEGDADEREREVRSIEGGADQQERRREREEDPQQTEGENASKCGSIASGRQTLFGVFQSDIVRRLIRRKEVLGASLQEGPGAAVVQGIRAAAARALEEDHSRLASVVTSSREGSGSSTSHEESPEETARRRGGEEEEEEEDILLVWALLYSLGVYA